MIRRHRPRVLLVTADFPPDANGVGDYTERLASHLADAGVEVGVLTRFATPQPADIERPYRVLRRVRDWTARGLPAAVDLCRGWDLVHVQYPGVACGRGMLMNLLPSRLAGVARTAATFHEFRSMRMRWRLRATALLRNLDQALVVDAADAHAVRRWSRLVRPLSPVTPEAVPIAANVETLPATPDDRAAWRAALGLAGGEVALAYFGIIYPHKGVDVLLDAARLLRDAGRHVRPVVIGNFDRDAAWRPPLEARLLDEAVWVRDADARRVSETLHACDMSVLPYASGAGPNRSSLLTAMAHGLPAVTTDGPSTPRDFARRADVAFVPPNDAPAVAAALTRLLESPGETADAAQRARAWADSLSWPAAAARHVDLYARLIGHTTRATTPAREPQHA